MSAMDDLAKALDSAIGANSAKQKVEYFIGTGYEPLDEIISGSMNGGLPQGRLMEMYGPSSSGKTALATMMMVNAQKQGGIAGFMDHERSFNVDLAKNMGLNDVSPSWIYKIPRTWEESNMWMAKAAQVIREKKVIDPKAPIFFVLDSIAASVPKSALDKSLDELNMNDSTALSRVTSQTLKTMAVFAEDYNFSVLYLNQIRTKPGVMFGDPTTTPGGTSMEFFSTVRLSLGRKKIMKDKEFIGQDITIKTVKNKLTRPFQEITLRMAFDETGFGYFDIETSMIEHLMSLGKLEKSGNYIVWTDGKKYYPTQLADAIRKTGQYDQLVAILRK